MTKPKKNLEILIEKRKREAEEKDIKGKAFTVARFLGTCRSLNTGNGQRGNEYTYEKGVLKIVALSGSISGSDGTIGFSRVVVDYKGEQVFEERGGRILRYIPGTWWERTFNRRHNEAEEKWSQYSAKQARERKARETTDDSEERRKWGL